MSDNIHDPHGKYAKQTDQESINLRKLPIGSLVFARTKNNEYLFEIIDDKGTVVIEGGKYFDEPVETYFSGSTFGDSMLMVGSIGEHMLMEIENPATNKLIITTPVSAAKVISISYPGYFYEPSWSEW